MATKEFIEKMRAKRSEKRLETFADDFGDGNINELKKDLTKGNSQIKMSIDQLKPFSEYDPNYNQYDYNGERFEELMKSIETTGGVIEPLIIWETDEKEYIILSGKHRWLALKNLSKKDTKYKEVPVVLKKDITKEEAVFIFNTSNMTRRSFESMGNYQKAAALYQITDSYRKIMKKRIKDELGNRQNVDAGGRVTEQVGKQYGLTAYTISKYIKLYKTLTKDQFSSIDNKLISLDNAYAISDLEKPLLNDIFKMIEDKDLVIDSEKAKEIKNECDKGIILDIKKIITICNKKKTKKSYSIKVNEIEEFNDFFKNKDEEEIEKTIKEALKEYIENHK